MCVCVMTIFYRLMILKRFIFINLLIVTIKIQHYIGYFTSLSIHYFTLFYSSYFVMHIQVQD